MAYATVAEVRPLEGLADATTYPDATLQDGIDFATETIDDYCGTSFEHKPFTVTLDGRGAASLYTGVLFIASITAVTFDGDPQDEARFVGRPEGTVVFLDGVFPIALAGRNIVISGTAGATATVPERIAWAARTLARQYALELHTRIPSRALRVSNELGEVEVRAQPGGPGRPTALPDVNAVLNANKHKAGHSGRVAS